MRRQGLQRSGPAPKSTAQVLHVRLAELGAPFVWPSLLREPERKDPSYRTLNLS